MTITYLVKKDHVVNRSFLGSSILDVVYEDAFDDQSCSSDATQEERKPNAACHTNIKDIIDFNR